MVWRLDATGQAELIRSGQVSAGEVVKAALARADAMSGLHAVTARLDERASTLPAGATDPGGAHTDFVLARSVRDLRAILAAVSPSPAGRARAVARVGVLQAMPFGLGLAPAVAAALDQVAVRLAGLGHEVIEIRPSFLERYGQVLGAEVQTVVDANRAGVVAWIEDRLGRPATDDDLAPAIIEASRRGRRLTAGEVEGARDRIRRAADVAAGWVAEVDALLLPVLATPPWPIGVEAPATMLAGLICSLANFAGQPAITVPTVQGAVPVGVQLQGPAWSDEALLDVVASGWPVALSSPVMAAMPAMPAMGAM